MLKPVKKYLLAVLGSLALLSGAIGIFIPVLPTTPFLLLASYCYLRSSDRLYLWLIRHRLFGVYIYNYVTYKAISKTTKIAALFFLWLTLFVSILSIDNWLVRGLLLLVGAGVSIHLCTLKTLPKTNRSP